MLRFRYNGKRLIEKTFTPILLIGSVGELC